MQLEQQMTHSDSDFCTRADRYVCTGTDPVLVAIVQQEMKPI